MANSFPSAGGGNRPGSYQRRNVDPFAAIRRNHRIKVPQVRLISPEGKQLERVCPWRRCANGRPHRGDPTP